MELAQVLETASGKIQNLERAANIYRDECENGNGEACARIAVMYERGAGVFRSREMAKQYRKKACDAGRKESCEQPQPGATKS